MNIKMKALIAAAVAAMSVSGAANAALTNGLAGDSSLVLTLLDRASNISATFDLGSSYSAFSAGGAGSSSSTSWDLTTGDYAAAWNSFFSVADANNVLWGVAASDNIGSVAVAGSKGFITTLKEGQTLNNNLRTTQTSPPLNGFDTYLNGNNDIANPFKNSVGVGNHDTVENGASVATGGNAYAGNFYSLAGAFYGLGHVALDKLGNEQGVIQTLTGAGVTGYLTYTIYDASFYLDANGLLTYTIAAVPEPETYALLLAGLGLVGAAARRRKSA